MIGLEIDSVGVSYGDRPVLTAASLRAPPGKVTELVGRNGVGKTTLLRVGVGLQQATHGVVRFNGRAYVRPRLSRLARAGLFYLPAREILDPFIPAGLQLQAVSRHYKGPNAEALAESFGLAELFMARPASFSGGELRRAIDPRDVEVIGLALRSAAAAGAAVVVTGHELGPLREMADAVVWCVAGTTHEFPQAADGWADAQLQRDFLGSDL